MPIEVLMPILSPTMKDGNLAKWLKNEGDEIEPGDIIAEIETDKATMELEASQKGILKKIIVPSGSQNVKVNSLIAVMLSKSEDSNVDLSEFISNFSSNNENKENNSDNNQQNSNNISLSKNSINGVQIKNERLFASPLAKRIARINNIDLTKIVGTGPRGRIIKRDLFDETNIKNNNEEYKILETTNIRRIIAKKLLESKQQIPHFYLSIECKVDDLLKARKELNDELSKNIDDIETKLSVNDFVIVAAANAISEIPEVNASWDDGRIKLYRNIDISVAVSVKDGLITPIIRNADKKNIKAISIEMKQLASKARSNKLVPEDFIGGGFSISNLGMYNIKNFQAIINPPQSAILAVGSVNDKVIVVNGEIKIAKIMEVSLSCDHRVIDGVVGAKFLHSFQKYLESPILCLSKL